MKRFAALTLIASVPVLTMGYFLVVGPYLERRPIEIQLEKIPGVELVRAWGDLDIGISAALVLDDGSTLEFDGLSEEAVAADGHVCVARVGSLGALTVGCPIADMPREAGPSWTYCFPVDPGGTMGALLAPSPRSVREAVGRRAELRRLFEDAPRCPEKKMAPWANESWNVFYCVNTVDAGQRLPVFELNCGAPGRRERQR